MGEPAYAWRLLDALDCAVLLVGPGGTLQHANPLARHELARGRFLRVESGRVATPCAGDADALECGMLAAARGQRQILTLRSGVETLCVACVPLARPGPGAEPAPVLLLLADEVTLQGMPLFMPGPDPAGVPAT